MMKRKLLSMLVLLVAVVTGAWANVTNVQGDADFPATYGTWTFDDGTTAGTGTATLAASDGVTFADGAATVPVNEMLSMTTNAGGDLTTYTFMMDVKVLNENSGRYTALFKTTLNDADLFIFNHKTNGRKIGINANGMGFGGSINLNQWYRVVFSCTDAVATVYVDGVKVAAATSANTDKWTMHDVAYFFADNDGEENEITCDKISFWNVALTEAQAALLGGVGTEIPGAATYTVSMKEDTEDAANWTAKAGTGQYQQLPLSGVEAGTVVILKYDGRKKVRGVKAVKEVAGPVAHKLCPDDQHPHWIDLGLPSGTLWQCCNEGATAPEGYGNYYNYDDAQSYNPPTKAQIEELLDGNNTTSEWTTLNNVNGRWFTSKTNGGKVFLPAAGYFWYGELYDVGSYGNYWSSTPGDLDSASALNFDSDGVECNNGDCSGLVTSVRPVRKN